MMQTIIGEKGRMNPCKVEEAIKYLEDMRKDLDDAMFRDDETVTGGWLNLDSVILLLESNKDLINKGLKVENLAEVLFMIGGEEDEKDEEDEESLDDCPAEVFVESLLINTL